MSRLSKTPIPDRICKGSKHEWVETQRVAMKRLDEFKVTRKCMWCSTVSIIVTKPLNEKRYRKGIYSLKKPRKKK